MDEPAGCMEGRSFAAIGDSGNMIYVSPQRGIVAVIAARFKPAARIPVELITNHIVPLFES